MQQLSGLKGFLIGKHFVLMDAQVFNFLLRKTVNMQIDFEFFSPLRSLLGFSYEILNMSHERDANRNPIITRYATISIGMLILTATVSIRLKKKFVVKQ